MRVWPKLIVSFFVAQKGEEVGTEGLVIALRQPKAKAESVVLSVEQKSPLFGAEILRKGDFLPFNERPVRRLPRSRLALADAPPAPRQSRGQLPKEF